MFDYDTSLIIIIKNRIGSVLNNLNDLFLDGVESRFMCPNSCGKSYRKSKALKQHLEFHCGVEPKFECYICLKKFSRKGTLKGHLVLIHGIVNVL